MAPLLARTSLAFALCALGLALAPARARADAVLLSPGLLAFRRFEGNWGLQGELSALWMGVEERGRGNAGASALMGIALDFGSTRIALELEPVLWMEAERAGWSFVIGLDPGVVYDRSGEGRWGGQATLWADAIARGGGYAPPLPLIPFPFVRAELFTRQPLAWSAGLMIKIPVPVWASD